MSDLDQLKSSISAEIASASDEAAIEGVRRILDLENRVAALAARNEELVAELEATREALRSTLAARRTSDGAGDRLPVLRRPEPGQSVVVWRRGR